MNMLTSLRHKVEYYSITDQILVRSLIISDHGTIKFRSVSFDVLK